MPWTSTRAGLLSTTEKGAADGLAELNSNSLLPTAQLPPVATTENYTVASSTERLSLTPEKGDFAIQTDTNETYFFTGGDPSLESNWQVVETPSAKVSSVFGRTGDITASSGDYSHSQISNIGSGDHHTRYADSEARTAVDGASISIAGAADTTQGNLDDHSVKSSSVHGISSTDNVAGISDIDTHESSTGGVHGIADTDTVASGNDLSNHTSDTTNPHNVTSDQVGALSNTGDQVDGELVGSRSNASRIFTTNNTTTGDRFSWRVNSADQFEFAGYDSDGSGWDYASALTYDPGTSQWNFGNLPSATGETVATRPWVNSNLYSDENAQDAVGGALTADLSYNDSNNTIGLSSSISTANIKATSDLDLNNDGTGFRMTRNGDFDFQIIPRDGTGSLVTADQIQYRNSARVWSYKGDANFTAGLQHQGNTVATQTWVNNNADVPNANYADSAGDANTLDGNDSTAFADSGHLHDSRYVQIAGDTMSGNLNLGQNQITNHTLHKVSSRPSSPAVGQMIYRTDKD